MQHIIIDAPRTGQEDKKMTNYNGFIEVSVSEET